MLHFTPALSSIPVVCCVAHCVLTAGDTIGMFEVLFASSHAFTAIATSDCELSTVHRHVRSTRTKMFVQHIRTRVISTVTMSWTYQVFVDDVHVHHWLMEYDLLSSA